MAKDTLYVANFPAEVDETQLRELFGQHGEITSIQFGVDEKYGQRYALVQMAAERMSTVAINALNGHRIGDRYLAVSYPDFDPDRELFSKQRQALEAIIADLGETEKIPLRELEMMARQCGISFLQGILKDTLEVEASDGLLFGDPPRRRTKGGVFFYLARFRMSPQIRHVVYTRTGKPPKPADEQQQEQANRDSETP